MHNTMNYTTQNEDINTLKTMKENFDHGYDKDPTLEESNLFERSRKESIESWYKSLEKNSMLEEKMRELLSSNTEIQKTVNNATLFHKDQIRKIDNIPYIEHPIAVWKILSRVTQEIPVIEAWLLHDVIEDVKNGRTLLERNYPREIIDLVDSVSEQNKSLPRKERKIAYLEHLSNANYKSLLISLADRIHNLRTMIQSFEKYWENIREKFNAGYEQQKWFLLSYSRAIDTAINKIGSNEQKIKVEVLYKEFKEMVAYFLEKTTPGAVSYTS